jgi:hypothetical protein
MNGPTPIMFVMFNAVAGRRPKRRVKCGESGGTTPALAMTLVAYSRIAESSSATWNLRSIGS